MMDDVLRLRESPLEKVIVEERDPASDNEVVRDGDWTLEPTLCSLPTRAAFTEGGAGARATVVTER